VAENSAAKPAYREVEADLEVLRRETAADGVVTLTLAHPDGSDLPDWTAGAHIDLVLSDSPPWSPRRPEGPPCTRYRARGSEGARGHER
jgi:hypothetical protein